MKWLKPAEISVILAIFICVILLVFKAEPVYGIPPDI